MLPHGKPSEAHVCAVNLSKRIACYCFKQHIVKMNRKQRKVLINRVLFLLTAIASISFVLRKTADHSDEPSPVEKHSQELMKRKNDGQAKRLKDRLHPIADNEAAIKSVQDVSEDYDIPKYLHAADDLKVIPPLKQQLKPFYHKKHTFNCRKIVQEVADEKNSTLFAWNSEKIYHIYKNTSNCSYTKSRFFYSTNPASKDEAEFPLAFAISIYDSFEQLELLMSALYQPQNSYCIHVDLKAPLILHQAVKRYASCFPNIFIAERMYPVNRFGRLMMKAFDACFEVLEKRRWRYVVTVQNHDFPLKTNAEMVRILRLHRGANDLQLRKGQHFRFHFPAKDAEDSDGFPVDSSPGKGGPTQTPPGGLAVYQGYVQASLSRDFVTFIRKNQTAKELLDWLDGTFRGAEFFYSTLNHNGQPPGGYPGRCVSGDPDEGGAAGCPFPCVKPAVTRFSTWLGHNSYQCKGAGRHGMCSFGVGDLARLAKRPEMLANKFLLAKDPLPLLCAHELHFNRTHYPERYKSKDFGFDEDFYASLPAVQFQKWRMENPTKPWSDFKCLRIGAVEN